VPRGPRGLLLAIVLSAGAICLAGCGGRFALPPDATGSSRTPNATGSSGQGTLPLSTAGTSTATEGDTVPTTPVGGTASRSAPAPRSNVKTAPSPQDAVSDAYQAYLADLSGLDDTFNRAYIAPLESVTTARLAQASLRQAQAILAAQEHGVGTLRDDHVAITMTGPSSAALADCQDEENFYLVMDDSGAPDPFVARGYFVGSAQLVLQDGHWLVDTFTTTHVPCTF
jgi:hypothetical protein